MSKSITLYHLEQENIKINVVARFQKRDLIIDGCDTGRTVKEIHGDYDYEYMMTIPAKSLPRLYGLLDVKERDPKGLLKALVNRFHGKNCFSEIGDFLDQNDIDYSRLTWA